MRIQVTCKCGQNREGLFFRRTVSEAARRVRVAKAEEALTKRCLECSVKKQKARRKRVAKEAGDEVSG